MPKKTIELDERTYSLLVAMSVSYTNNSIEMALLSSLAFPDCDDDFICDCAEEILKQLKSEADECQNPKEQ